MYRKQHHVRNLDANNTIANISQTYSCKMADTFDFTHNNQRNKQGAGLLGENIYFEGQSNQWNITDSACARKENLLRIVMGQNFNYLLIFFLIKVYGMNAVDSWYSEVENYDFSTGKSKNGGDIGHFTQ